MANCPSWCVPSSNPSAEMASVTSTKPSNSKIILFYINVVT
jgi:hypothetical protein